MAIDVRVPRSRRASPDGGLGGLASIAASVTLILIVVLAVPSASASALRPVVLNATLTPATWYPDASTTGSGSAVVEINAERTRMTYLITYAGVPAGIRDVIFCASVWPPLGPNASAPDDDPHYCAILAGEPGGPSPINGSGRINYNETDAPDPQAVRALVGGVAYIRLSSTNGPELEGPLALNAPPTDVVTPAETQDRWTTLFPVLAGVLAFLAVIRGRNPRNRVAGRR